MQTEKQIVESVKKGERKGQDELVSRFAAPVFAMIARQVQDSMDAQELLQDTFLKAFRYIGRFDDRQSSLTTWLCRIAYQQTIDFLRRHQPITVSLEDSSVWQTDISDTELETELSTGKEQRIEQLETLMKELPHEDRMLLTLYYFDDLPLNEITYIMGIDANALASRLYRIRKKLYKKLTAI